MHKYLSLSYTMFIPSSLWLAKRYTRYNLLVSLYPVYTWYKPQQAKLSNGYQIPDELSEQKSLEGCLFFKLLRAFRAVIVLNSSVWGPLTGRLKYSKIQVPVERPFNSARICLKMGFESLHHRCSAPTRSPDGLRRLGPGWLSLTVTSTSAEPLLL